jgi:hypothetical protein
MVERGPLNDTVSYAIALRTVNLTYVGTSAMPRHRARLVLHAERGRREKVDAGWVPPL